MADYPVTQVLITVGHGCRNRCGLLDYDGDQQKGETDEQGQEQQVDENYTGDTGDTTSLQPGYGGSEHRTHDDGDEQDEEYLVETVEQPEAETNDSQDERGPYDSPECPGRGG